MSRRTVASLLAAGLLVAFVVAGALLPVPYVTMSPGYTVDVLGKDEGEPILTVEGTRTYPTEGELRLTTVSVTRPDSNVSLLDALGGWLEGDVEVMPHEAMYPPGRTAERERSESAAQMVSSQDTAVAVALSELGYDLESHAEVTGVAAGGPAEGKLEPRDRIEAVDGTPVPGVEELFAALEDVEPGDPVRVRVVRDGKEVTVPVTTRSSEQDPDRAMLGIFVGTGYDLPFEVDIAIDERIGGPSAGLVFALSVYDALTPGSLTGGASVAGTGTIGPDGDVGPIGGVRQKIVGAEESGAELFLVPPGNCAAAVHADVDEIRLVRADTMHSAVQSLEKYAEDKSADLPRCPS